MDAIRTKTFYAFVSAVPAEVIKARHRRIQEALNSEWVTDYDVPRHPPSHIAVVDGGSDGDVKRAGGAERRSASPTAVQRLLDAAMPRSDHVGGHGADEGIERLRPYRIHHALADPLRIEPGGGEAFAQHRFVRGADLRTTDVVRPVPGAPRDVGRDRSGAQHGDADIATVQFEFQFLRTTTGRRIWSSSTGPGWCRGGSGSRRPRRC